jgi:hypothetical protein
MKNIHLLPKSEQKYQVKEGGLFINDTRKHSWGKLEVLKCERITVNGHTWNGTGIRTDICHLYITSDEQPKHNDYYTTDGKEIYYCNTLNPTRNNHYKKVILTTDQDLIENGIQAIDDEFLEWFANNPSCEFVEVKKQMLCDYCGQEHCDNLRCRGYKDSPYYEIIIPQEDPKQETLEKEIV